MCWLLVEGEKVEIVIAKRVESRVEVRDRKSYPHVGGMMMI